MAKYQKNPAAFCRVTYDEMFPFGLINGFKLPENKHGCLSLEITSENALSLCVTWQNTSWFLEGLSSLEQGFLRPAAILKAEEALGTRLATTDEVFSLTQVNFR